MCVSLSSGATITFCTYNENLGKDRLGYIKDDSIKHVSMSTHRHKWGKNYTCSYCHTNQTVR